MATLANRWFDQPEQAQLRKTLYGLNVASASAVLDHIGKKTNNRNPVIAKQNQEAVELFISLSDKQRRSLMTRFNYNSLKQVLWAVTGRPRVAGKAVSKEIAEEQVSNILRTMRTMKRKSAGQSVYQAGNIKSTDNSKAQLELNELIHSENNRLVDAAHEQAIKFNDKLNKTAPVTTTHKSSKTA